MANLTYWIGLLLCLLAAAQALLWIIRGLLGVMRDSQAHRLRIEQLNAEIAAARNRHTVLQQSTSGWEGFRKFRVSRKVEECLGSNSFYLVPHDGKTLPSYSPGQYLTFQFRIPGQSKPVIRCYSLSDAPGRDYYRCTIKKVPPPRDKPEVPSGVASTYMNEEIQEGDILDVKSPRGSFFLDTDGDRPVVLLGGGVGITPMLSMMNTIALSGSNRQATLFYGVTNGTQHIARNEIAALCDNHSNLTAITCFSNPTDADQVGRTHDVHGRVTMDVIKQRLGPAAASNYDFFLCGPGPFMDSLTEGLKIWGVPDSSVHSETFGPSSVKRKPKPAATTDASKQPKVKFGRSGREIAWDPSCPSLLDFAEANGIEVESGCRSGNCGTCALAIKDGAIEYTEEPSSELESGTCLPCVCVPDGSLVLDA